MRTVTEVNVVLRWPVDVEILWIGEYFWVFARYSLLTPQVTPGQFDIAF